MTRVRPRDWKRVHFLGVSLGQQFDLRADPDEVQNCRDDPAGKQVKQALLDALREWRIHSRFRTSTWSQHWR